MYTNYDTSFWASMINHNLTGFVFVTKFVPAEAQGFMPVKFWEWLNRDRSHITVSSPTPEPPKWGTTLYGPAPEPKPQPGPYDYPSYKGPYSEILKALLGNPPVPEEPPKNLYSAGYLPPPQNPPKNPYLRYRAPDDPK